MKTIEDLSVYEAEKQIRDYLRELYVGKPREPLLKSNKPTKEDIDNYTKLTEQYEVDLAEYKIKDDLHRTESKRLWNLLEDKIKDNQYMKKGTEGYLTTAKTMYNKGLLNPAELKKREYE